METVNAIELHVNPRQKQSLRVINYPNQTTKLNKGHS